MNILTTGYRFQGIMLFDACYYAGKQFPEIPVFFKDVPFYSVSGSTFVPNIGYQKGSADFCKNVFNSPSNPSDYRMENIGTDGSILGHYKVKSDDAMKTGLKHLSERTGIYCPIN